MTDTARHLLALMAAALVLSSVGCGNIEPEPLTDEDGEAIPQPDPGEEWLFVVAADPEEEISTDAVLALEFNQYLDVTTFSNFSTMRLVSGGRNAFGRVDYRMTRKTLLFQPYNRLDNKLTYSVDWLAEDIESVIGSPLHPRSAFPFFEARSDLDPVESFERPDVSWDDVAPLFQSYCNDCHGEDRWGLPELTPDGMIGTPSTQTDTRLVEPYAPVRSYLMHKILPDYPLRRHTVQPPPYSEHAGALSTEDIELIEHWIAGGARD